MNETTRTNNEAWREQNGPPAREWRRVIQQRREILIPDIHAHLVDALSMALESGEEFEKRVRAALDAGDLDLLLGDLRTAQGNLGFLSEAAGRALERALLVLPSMGVILRERQLTGRSYYSVVAEGDRQHPNVTLLRPAPR